MDTFLTVGCEVHTPDGNGTIIEIKSDKHGHAILVVEIVRGASTGKLSIPRETFASLLDEIRAFKSLPERRKQRNRKL